MKKICTLLLTAGMLFGVATGASAIDFKAAGQWLFGFGAVNTQMNGADGSDAFVAQQRIRLQIDAVASEALSGTVFFEIGDTRWGQASSGGQLGTDGKIVEVKRAYLDWVVPDTELTFRMGLQGLALPNVAGGSAILDDDVAGVVASYKFNDMVSLALAWARPLNDNYDDGAFEYNDEDLTTFPAGKDGGSSNYLDNVDLFTLMLPVQGNDWKVTPWFMYGAMGNNADASIFDSEVPGNTSYLTTGLFPLTGGYGIAPLAGAGVLGQGFNWNGSGNAYTDIWFAGLPMGFAFDAWNIELDLNYGSVGYSGTYTATNIDKDKTDRIDSQRAGWLVKGLFEYKMDWGTPGLFAWYGSGDDSDVSDGSEMMPYLDACGNFTSFIGDGNELGWNPGTGYDLMLNYSGTWGVGLQFSQMAFMEDLSHTFRVAYWRGTNMPKNAEFMGSPYQLQNNGFYLTTNDYLVEFNLDNTYQVYENLQAVVQLGYIVNGMDKDTWSHMTDDERRDAYKATLTFSYSF